MDRQREYLAAAERKAAMASLEAEEARAHQETAEKSKRLTEMELSDTKDALGNVEAQLNSLNTHNRSLESDFSATRSELDEMVAALRHSEEKAKKAAIDAMTLAEEVRLQQGRADHEEADRRAAEAVIKELQIRVEEAESNALRGGKKIIEKLEAQIRHLNAELDTEQRIKVDFNKNLRKAERKYREIEFQLEEEHKNCERMQVYFLVSHWIILPFSCENKKENPLCIVEMNSIHIL